MLSGIEILILQYIPSQKLKIVGSNYIPKATENLNVYRK